MVEVENKSRQSSSLNQSDYKASAHREDRVKKSKIPSNYERILIQ